VAPSGLFRAQSGRRGAKEISGRPAAAGWEGELLMGLELKAVRKG